MMKTIVAFVAILGLALAAPSTRGLDDDLQEFVDLIPTEELKAIVNKYLTSDDEFKAVISYLKGSEWAELVAEVRAKPEVQEFKEYLISAGIDVDKILDWIHNWITGVETSRRVSTRGVKEFVEEVKAALPVDEIKVLFKEKLENSADFQEFYAKVSSEKAHGLVEEIRAIPEVQRLAARLLELGIDVKPVLEFIYNLFGWN